MIRRAAVTVEPERLGRAAVLAGGRIPGHAITDVIVARRTGQVDVGDGALDRAQARVAGARPGPGRREALVHLAAVCVALADRG